MNELLKLHGVLSTILNASYYPIYSLVDIGATHLVPLAFLPRPHLFYRVLFIFSLHFFILFSHKLSFFFLFHYTSYFYIVTFTFGTPSTSHTHTYTYSPHSIPIPILTTNTVRSKGNGISYQVERMKTLKTGQFKGKP